LKLFNTIIIIVIFLGTLFIFHKPLLATYAKSFTINNPTKGADLIMVLSGNPPVRVERASTLFAEGYSSNVAVSSLRPMSSKYSHIIDTQSQMVQKAFGVDKIKCTFIPSLKGGATSTFDEAYDLIAYVKEHNLTHIILVTDSFHSRRAYYAFKKVFKKYKMGTKLEMASATNQHFSEENWWMSERGVNAYILEPLKFFIYLFRDNNLPIIKES
jgi:uncharacterized SAM-binding protein YcdF (DUF218 family)